MNDLIPKEDELKVLQVMATHASKSKFFDKLGGQEGCMCVALMARELGVPIMSALSGGIRYILGNVEISPRLMNSMIRQKGHKLEISESTNTSCTIKGTRSDTGESYTCTFSFEDAKQAGLVKSGGGWEKYASDMLFARCISRLSRRLFPDVIGAAYVEGEIDQSKPVKQEVKTPVIKEEEFSVVEKPSLNNDEICEMLGSQLTIPNYELLPVYLDIAREKMPKDKTMEEVVSRWLDNPDAFLRHYGKFCSESISA